MTMTTDDEEKMILDQILGSRHTISVLKKQASDIRMKIARAEQEEEHNTQALIDFYNGNGVTGKSECGKHIVTLGKSRSVEIIDMDSVPEKYIRTKTIKEVNKALIKAEDLPASNWLHYNDKQTITIKHKDA